MLVFSKVKSIFISVSFLFAAFTSFSQSFTNNNLTSIPDNGTVNVPVQVSGLSPIDTTNYGLESVTVSVDHPANSELILQLQSPDGSTILLARDLTGSNMDQTVFDAISASYIDFGSGNYNGNFRPIVDLSYLNNSQNPNGTWNLIVKDIATGNIGTVKSVTLSFGNKPAKPLLSSSNLPIIKINTNGQQILDDPKIVADMSIIYNGPGQMNFSNQTNYYYHGKIGIELRGHGSQEFPKKQYGFETRDQGGVNDIKVSFFGFPDESDWILSANYSDKSMMRNILAYRLSNDMGHYASRTKYCEVIINNEYRGVFVFQEKLKRDKNRINIDKIGPSDITYPSVTGGYIYSKDYVDGSQVTWDSKITNPPVQYQFVYPKAEDVVTEQKAYLQSYVDSFELALNGPDYQDPLKGFRNFADETSFMDYFIVVEASKNIDGFRLSSYFNKSRLGKIKAGPVWDYDIAWGNASYDDGSLTTGFAYAYNYASDEPKVPFIWGKLMTDNLWKLGMSCRYNTFRQNILSQQYLNTLIDSLALELQFPQKRNFTRWNIIGKEIWPNPSPVPVSFEEEISSLKSWINNRLLWIDAELQSPCGGPLSITLVSFEAANVNNVNKLTWTTNAELNNSYFAIERSADGRTFTQIGTVKGMGMNSVTNTYSYDDINLSGGNVFYRLKQVDFNGKFTYSKVIELNNQYKSWRLNFNKTDGNLTIFSPLSGNQQIRLSIYNMDGKLMRSSDVLNTNVIIQNLTNFSKGIYILEIIDAKGKNAALRFYKD